MSPSEYLKQNPNVDVVHSTTDGNLFFTISDAKNYAKTLKDDAVTTTAQEPAPTYFEVENQEPFVEASQAEQEAISAKEPAAKQAEATAALAANMPPNAEAKGEAEGEAQIKAEPKAEPKADDKKVTKK